MTSVARKTHMPNVAAECCCSRSWNCSSSRSRARTECLSVRRSAGVNREFSRLILRLFEVIFVRTANDLGRFGKIVDRRRRRSLPFQPRRAPRIGPCPPAVIKRQQEVTQREHVTCRENRRARRRKHVPDLKLGDVLVV